MPLKNGIQLPQSILIFFWKKMELLYPGSRHKVYIRKNKNRKSRSLDLCKLILIMMPLYPRFV